MNVKGADRSIDDDDMEGGEHIRLVVLLGCFSYIFLFKREKYPTEN